MTVGRKEYTEAELMRMQRDAEERVREMNSRARQVVDQDPAAPPPAPPPRNRNWNSNPNMRRPNNRRPYSAPPPEPSAEQPVVPPEPEREPVAQNSPPAETPPKKTTIVEDVMGALNLDEDYLLIIGLLLILVNQRADTTLILALAYLLI